MSSLDDIIRDTIRAEGPMSVAKFMDIALQHPQHGYYRTHDPLGKAGDFTTAPEITQMFGEMIGLWCAQTWRAMGEPVHFTLLELGPGRGTLMNDALRATRHVAGFHEAMELCLLESNQTLRAKQSEILVGHLPRHLDNIENLLPQPLIAVANEFFDALPIHQFIRDGENWLERKIELHGEALVFAPEKFETECREVSPLSHHFVRQLAHHIATHGGACLTVDYGYVAPPPNFTFQAVSKHEYAPPLQRVGEVDLTAHVNFSALAETARAAAMEIHGPISQAEFLDHMGIHLRAAQLRRKASVEQIADMDSALRRLLDPAQMGTLFKAMCFANPQLKDVVGFV